MSRADDEAVRELLDRAAIRDVLLRYARGVDRRDLDLVASCFVPGAEYDGALGQGTIETALMALRRSLERYQSTMHFMGNQLIEVAGDTASSETYAVAYHRLKGDGEPALFVVGVRYLDDFARAGDGWRIRRRVVKMEWKKTDQSSDRSDLEDLWQTTK
jgi:3-phenylpropionate/cinnamic acid dioxygenase small subunit